MEAVAIRWTIGDVSAQGYEALGCSIRGAWKLFGPSARYAVCVNSVPIETARERAGAVPAPISWHDATGGMPGWLGHHVDGAYAEGVAWKFAPPRLFPDCYELSLDNDVILWAMPATVREWLDDGACCLIAEDVRPCLGQFAGLCSGAPRNSGMRGLPPGFDLEAKLRAILREHPVRLCSETDEQGLQTLLVEREPRTRIVSVEEVAICSPFPPHLPSPGRCGVHFVGLNTRALPWTYEGRGGHEYIWEHWERWRPHVQAQLGVTEPTTRCA